MVKPWYGVCVCMSARVHTYVIHCIKSHIYLYSWAHTGFLRYVLTQILQMLRTVHEIYALENYFDQNIRILFILLNQVASS